MVTEIRHEASEEVVSRFEKGQPADPTQNMSPEDAKKWREEHEKNKDKFKKKEAETADEKQSRFEEGKPADPTENMSPEDAKKWREEHEKNKDKFKTAAAWNAKPPGWHRGGEGFAWDVYEDASNQVTYMMDADTVPSIEDPDKLMWAWTVNLSHFPAKGSMFLSPREWIDKADVPSSLRRGLHPSPPKGPYRKTDAFFLNSLDAAKAAEAHWERNKNRMMSRVVEASVGERIVDRFLKFAGFSYATDRMSVLFVEGRKPVPFNIDTIRAINRTEVPVIGDDGEIHDVFLKVIGKQYSGPLTYNQEQMGMRRETRVDLQIPVDEGGSVDTAERTALAEMAQLGRKFGFTVEPVRMGYRPQTRTISRFKKAPRSKPFPFRSAESE